MIRSRTIFPVALCVAGAFAGCKQAALEKPEAAAAHDGGVAYLVTKPSERPAQPAEPARPAEVAEQAAGAPSPTPTAIPAEAKADAKGEPTEGGTTHAPAPASEVGKRTAEADAAKARRFPTAQLSGPSSVSGLVTFRDTDGTTKVVIDMRGAKPGNYVVQTLNRGDCAAIAKMETPFAGGPGTAGEGSSNRPGPQETLALWRNVGVLAVDANGTGHAEMTAETIDLDRIDKNAVVIYPQPAPDAKPAKGSNVTACGIFGGARASEG